MMNYYSDSVAQKIRKRLLSEATSQRAKNLARFFKTGPGEYGEGDKFLGVTLPVIRKVVKEYNSISFEDINDLLNSSFHEERMVGVIILVEQYKKGDSELQKKIYEFYLGHTKKLNNWDFVDCSAASIVGQYLETRKKEILSQLAHSSNLWERRIAIIATFHFIKLGNYQDAIKIAEILLHDKEDLIHKAVGWMLREIGKRCGEEAEEIFLKKYYKTMPRTMLRYAIEKFSLQKKTHYMKK